MYVYLMHGLKLASNRSTRIRTQVNNLLTVVFWKRNVTWYTILSYLLVEKLLHTHAFAYKASQLYKKMYTST